MSIDRSWYTETELINRSYTRKFAPLPPISIDPSDAPTKSACINEYWWSFLIGCLEDLLHRDAWEGTDEERQASVNSVIRVMDAIANRRSCVPTITFQTDCGCNVINYDNEVQNYFRYNIENETINEFNQSTTTIKLLPTGSHQEQEDAVAELIDQQKPSAAKLCQACTVMMYWLHDIGLAAKQGKIEFTTPVPLLDKIANWASTALTIGQLISKLFPASAAVTAYVGTAAQIAWIADDINHWAAAILTSDFTENEINDFICAMFEDMDVPNAGYTEFVNIFWGDNDMADIWAGIVNPDLYGTFLALLDDPSIPYEFYCCTTCIDTYAGYNEVLNGIRHHLYSEPVMLEDAPASGSIRTRKIRVRVHYEQPGVLREVRVVTQGQTYANVGTPNIQLATDVHALTDMIYRQTGLPATPTDMKSGGWFIAPASIVNGSQPATNWFEIIAEYALCSACSSTQLADFAKAWGYMQEIRYCLE